MLWCVIAAFVLAACDDDDPPERSFVERLGDGRVVLIDRSDASRLADGEVEGVWVTLPESRVPYITDGEAVAAELVVAVPSFDQEACAQSHALCVRVVDGE